MLRALAERKPNSQVGLKADLGCVAASCDTVARSTSGCRYGRDWRIGGSVMETPNLPAIRALRPAWNKGRIVGQKRPLKPKHVWAIRVRLELAENHRDRSRSERRCCKVKRKSLSALRFQTAHEHRLRNGWRTRSWSGQSIYGQVDFTSVCIFPRANTPGSSATGSHRLA